MKALKANNSQFMNNRLINNKGYKMKESRTVFETEKMGF